MLGFQVVDCGQPALTAVLAALGAEAEVLDCAARAKDHVLQAAVDARIFVQIVRIVGADADPRRSAAVGDRAQLRGFNVGTLEKVLEPCSCEAREVPIALGLVERILRCTRCHKRATRGLESVAELGPRGASQHTLIRRR